MKRTFNLLVEGMRGGAPIAELIDRLEKNIRETKELKAEIATTNITFVMFLTFIVVVIAPALFGLSYNLLVILGNIGEKLAFATQATSSMSINIGEIKVQPEQFRTFSMFALGVIATFTAMITSIIRKGNITQGIKYIPVYILSSVFMYIVLKAIFLSLFGGFGG